MQAFNVDLFHTGFPQCFLTTFLPQIVLGEKLPPRDKKRLQNGVAILRLDDSTRASPSSPSLDGLEGGFCVSFSGSESHKQARRLVGFFIFNGVE